MEFIFIIAGLILLFVGGEGLLKGSVSLAEKFGLSNFLIGAIVVGFGTSMPELSVSLKAAFAGAPGIVLGNVVGSNIANILLILGVCAVICPFIVNDRAMVRDSVSVILASALLCALTRGPAIGFAAGALLFAILIGYIILSYRDDRKKSAKAKAETIAHIEEDVGGDTVKKISAPVAVAYTLGGIAILIAGASLLVDGATTVARTFGIPEEIIGLSLVALGTSLPELATGIVAAIHKHTDIVLGNILGSCLFNILCILGLSAMVIPIDVSPHIASIDVWIMLGISIFLAVAIRTGYKISRTEGGMMLALYAGYIGWLALAV